MLSNSKFSMDQDFTFTLYLQPKMGVYANVVGTRGILYSLADGFSFVVSPPECCGGGIAIGTNKTLPSLPRRLNVKHMW